VHINCINCGHRFDLGRNYDDYEGLVRCSTCRGLLDIRTQDGAVKAVRPGLVQTMTASPVAPTVSATPGHDVVGTVQPAAEGQAGERQAAA
jgi:hypothetical protein